MNQLLTVLPFCTNDGILAEHLCDFIFLLNRRNQKGHCLLVVDGDVHPEMREKVRLAAQVAFLSVEVLNSPKLVDPNKNLHVNLMFKTAAEFIAKSYRIPWLWLEPDAIPVEDGWMEEITAAHFDQPKRYSGSYLMGGNNLFLARIAVYPPDAINELGASLIGNAPFNMASGGAVIPKSSKTRLVQETSVLDENFKPNAGVVLVHSDKSGILMNNLRESFEAAALKKGKK